MTMNNSNKTVTICNDDNKMPHNNVTQHLVEDPPPKVTSKALTVGWDTEYDNAKGCPPQPVMNQLVFHVDVPLHTLVNEFPVDTFTDDNGIKWKVYPNPLPRGLYIFAFELRGNHSFFKKNGGYIIVFTWDARGIQAGEEFQVFTHTCFENVRRKFGIEVKDSKPWNNQPNTKILTTYSNAEFSLITPDKASEQHFRKSLRKNTFEKPVYVEDSDEVAYVEEYKARVSEIQGTRTIFNYPLPKVDEFRNEEGAYEPDIKLQSVDILDTRHQGGSSVDAIGKAVGLSKVKGYDFDNYSASDYIESNPMSFAFYGAVDATISLLSELVIHESIIEVVNQLVDEGYLPNNVGNKKRTVDEARKKLTSSGVGEVIVSSYLKGEGKLKQFDRLKKWCVDNLSYNESKVQGGLTQRLEGFQLTAFYRFYNTFDFEAHYSHCMWALSPFPIYQPEGIGFMQDTAQNLVNRLSDCDWYYLLVSFTFNSDKKIDGTLLQNHEGESLVCQKVEKQWVNKAVLEVIAKIDPNVKIRVHEGKQWHPEILKTDLGQGESIEDYYIDLSPLMKRMIGMKNEYKKNGNPLMEKAVKLVMNSIYGKFAQDKEVYDPEALEESLINNGEISGVGNRTTCKSDITNPVLAGAITGLGRAVIWYVAWKFNAVNVATDSLGVAYDIDNINLQEVKTGYESLDRYLDIGKLKHETPYNTMTLLVSARGRVNIYHDETLARMIEQSFGTRDRQQLDTIIERAKKLRHHWETQGYPPPKINKDGVKYTGSGWDEWFACFNNQIRQHVGFRYEEVSTRLTKYSELYQGDCTYLNEQKTETTTKDCIDFRSRFWKDYDEFLTHKRLKDKYKRQDDEKRHREGGRYSLDDGISYGLKFRFEPEQFNKDIPKSQSRSRPTRTTPSDVKRAIALISKLGLVSQSEFARLLGVKQQSVLYWTRQLDNAKTTNHWGDRYMGDFKEIVGSIGKLSNSDRQAIVHKRQKIGLGNEVKDKRAVKGICNLIKRLEGYFGVTFQPKGKRAKKMRAVA